MRGTGPIGNLAFLVICLVSIVAAGFNSYAYSQSIKTQAEVVNVEIVEGSRGQSEIYTYQYYAEGTGYVESVGSFSWTSHDIGDTVTIHYTPAEPTRLVHPELIPVFMVVAVLCFIGLISPDPYGSRHK